MKPSLTLLVIVCVLLTSLGRAVAATAPSEKVRTISDVSSIPQRVLQRSISPKFYQSLLNSPVQGCIIVRGQLSGTKLSGMRVVHSELNGAYDALALERASAVTVQGYSALDKINQTVPILVHVLIYKIADGTLALSFAQLDEPSGDQQEYYGCATLAVLKKDGKWTEIKSVDSLQGKGLVLRTPRNSKREIWFFASFGSKGR